MPDVLIPDVPIEVIERLKARARAEGRSLESKLREMISRAEPAGMERKRQLFEAFDHEHAPVHFDPDPAELIRRERDRHR